MRIADRGIPDLPRLLGLEREGMRLAGHCDDLAPGGADLVEDSGLGVASQLEAAGRSPASAVVKQQQEFVLFELLDEPVAAHALRGVE